MADEREALRIQQDALNAERQRIADEAAERQRVIDAEFAAEHARILAAKQAEIAEQKRRERVDFELNGPGEVEIIIALCHHFKVAEHVARFWIANFDMAALAQAVEA
jgi:hypothetical protein